MTGIARNRVQPTIASPRSFTSSDGEEADPPVVPSVRGGDHPFAGWYSTTCITSVERLGNGAAAGSWVDQAARIWPSRAIDTTIGTPDQLVTSPSAPGMGSAGVQAPFGVRVETINREVPV